MIDRRSAGVVVLGTPIPQGSMTSRPLAPRKDGKPGPQTATYSSNATELKAWRRLITDQVARQYPGLTRTQPIFPRHEAVAVRALFVMPLRKADRWTDAHTAGTATIWHTVYPDLDKLVRAVFDALKDGHVWADDGQAAWVQARAVRGPTPQAIIRWAAL